ncbi:bactofilin family protein [Ferruginivarius sediminum]|nr:polymer-forming cytoskeletal protein [Ferruginivarius sediminum]
MTRPLVPGIPSRVVDPSGVVKRQDKTVTPPRESEVSDPLSNEGQLVVGKGIRFKGEITACDTLIVYGQVEASLPARAIQVAEGGDYQGTAEVDEAVIAGNFDGNLTVRQRLTIAATGRVKGTIRYAELEIAAGGQITGDIQLLEQQVPAETAKAAAETKSSVTNDKADQGKAGQGKAATGKASTDKASTDKVAEDKGSAAHRSVGERLREAVPELAESDESGKAP